MNNYTCAHLIILGLFCGGVWFAVWSKVCIFVLYPRLISTSWLARITHYASKHNTKQYTKHKTQNTKHKTQNTKHKTQNRKYKTQNSQLTTTNMSCHCPTLRQLLLLPSWLGQQRHQLMVPQIPSMGQCKAPAIGRQVSSCHGWFTCLKKEKLVGPWL